MEITNAEKNTLFAEVPPDGYEALRADVERHYTKMVEYAQEHGARKTLLALEHKEVFFEDAGEKEAAYTRVLGTFLRTAFLMHRDWNGEVLS